MLVKVLWVIACFIPIINLFPCWNGSDFVKEDAIKIIVVIVSVIFWIPAIIIGLLWAAKQF